MSPSEFEREQAAAAKKDRPRVVRYFEAASAEVEDRWIDDVVRRMDIIRREYPEGNYPEPSAKAEPGTQIEDDALRVLRASG